MKSLVTAPVEDPGLDSEQAIQRKQYMRELFAVQAKNYDLHNDIIGGLHRLWFLSLLGEIGKFMKNRESARMLALACGTGFVAFQVARRFDNIDIDLFDLSPEMVAIAKERCKGFEGRNFNFWVGDAEIPYGENKYDIIVTRFSFRNFANKNLATENVIKALKPGGVFIILDLTKPEHQPIKGLYLLSMRYLLPIPARILGIEKRAPRYLYNSVLMMPKNSELKMLLESKGFGDVSYKSLTFGIACMITGYKPKE